MAPYFACNSELLNKVTLTLSVSDSKNKHVWIETKRLKELGDESCVPPALAIAPSNIQTPAKPEAKSPVVERPISSHPAPGQPPATATSTVPQQSVTPTQPASGQSMNCRGSNCVLGPNFGNQFLVQDPGRGLNEEQFASLVGEMKKLDHGTAALILHQPIDSEMNRFGGQLQVIFTQAGWSLPAVAIDISNTHIATGDPMQRNTPEGLHCVTDGSKLGDDLFKLLVASGVHCSLASSTLYPTPQPQPNLTIFMGRNLE